MKIINVTFTTRSGGLEQAFLDYNECLSKNHQIVSLVHKLSPLVPLLTCPYYAISNYSKYDPLALIKIYGIIKKEKPDIIITHGNRAHYMLTLVAKHLIPIIGVSHNYSFAHITACDYIIAVSNDMRRQLISIGCKPSNVFHIPNMIKIPNNIVYSPPQLRNIPIIGILARLEKIKGVDIFIGALRLLKQQNILFKAKIAGDGPEYNNLQNLIHQYGLQSEIEMIGWIENKEDFFNNIDILCVPSRSETFGLVILESFIYSTPVIVSNLPGPGEIVQHEVTGLIFKSEDYQDLSVCITRIIYEKELPGCLTIKAFDHVKRYNMTYIGQRISQLLHKAL